MKPTVKIIYDRRKRSTAKGVAAAELYVYLNRQEKGYIHLARMTPEQWNSYIQSQEASDKVNACQSVIYSMLSRREPMTLKNFSSKFLSLSHDAVKKSFVDFVRDLITEERIKDSTKRNKYITLDAVVRFGRLSSFDDLTPDNLRDFDSWLHKEQERTDVTVHNYHKHMKKWTRLAYELHYITEDPYLRVHFPRGHCKERVPLTEAELLRLRDLPLDGHLAHARDLFIFSAYTGLAYCDVCAFDFRKMTEKVGDIHYIDGSRIKNGNKFFTPILPPAMDVLARYNYKLHLMSNMKVNDYLHVLEARLDLPKSITFHIARHSFATLCLSHDIPIENVARMLGHKDIRTTQIYAKILKQNVTRHGEHLASSIL